MIGTPGVTKSPSEVNRTWTSQSHGLARMEFLPSSDFDRRDGLAALHRAGLGEKGDAATERRGNRQEVRRDDGGLGRDDEEPLVEARSDKADQDEAAKAGGAEAGGAPHAAREAPAHRRRRFRAGNGPRPRLIAPRADLDQVLRLDHLAGQVGVDHEAQNICLPPRDVDEFEPGALVGPVDIPRLGVDANADGVVGERERQLERFLMPDLQIHRESSRDKPPIDQS